MRKIICCVLVVIFLAMSFWTLSQLGSVSPITASVGLFRVFVLDAEYARISLFPRAYLSPSENALEVFLTTMEHMGYEHHPEEQLGSLHWFTTQQGEWIKVVYSVNDYYATWIWC